MVAVSFSLVYATTKIFHVAHAGVYTLGGYLAWSLVDTRRAVQSWRCCSRSSACTAGGALIQSQLYARLERRRATHLVILIASLGTLAVMQNIIAAVYSRRTSCNSPLPWASRTSSPAAATCG